MTEGLTGFTHNAKKGKGIATDTQPVNAAYMRLSEVIISIPCQVTSTATQDVGDANCVNCRLSHGIYYWRS